jgi:peptide/nickel transport system substrate-binding protein
MGYVGFSGNVPGAPWTDPRVRQAVSLALDRDALLDAVYNLDKLKTQGFQVQYLWHNSVPAGVAYSVNPKTDAKANPYFKYDPDKAKALLAQAGYPNGFKASYHYNSGFGSVYTSYSELVAEYLSKVGINLDIGVQDNTSFFATTFAKNYDGLAHFFHGYAEPGDHLYAFFYSTSAYNLGKFVDKDLDQQLDTIQSNLDAQSRRQQIIDTQYYLLDKMYYVPTTFDAAPNWNGAQPAVHVPWDFMTTRGGFATGQRVHLWKEG